MGPEFMWQSQESWQLDRLFCSNHCCLGDSAVEDSPLLPFGLLLLWLWDPHHSCLFSRSYLRYIINTVEKSQLLALWKITAPCYSSPGTAQQGFRPTHCNCVSIRAGLPCKVMILDISSSCLQKNPQVCSQYSNSYIHKPTYNSRGF